MIARGTLSYNIKRPINVSFELTHSCTCNCLHCDHGGMVPREVRLTPLDYGRLEREIKPTLLQLSGGEPLLRPDLLHIIKAVKEKSGLPYLIVVTNGSLLKEDFYLACVEAGVNQFSISLDFPDARHDEFRRHDGLFQHLSDLLPKLAAHGHENIVLNTAVTSLNLPLLEACHEKAVEWDVDISYSPYTAKRTGESKYSVEDPEELELLDETMAKLSRLKRTEGRIANSDWTLTGISDFFRNGGIPGCSAGERSIVVNPDGTMRPCSMFDLKFKDRREMAEKFVRNNDCKECYVAIRAYLNQSYWKLLFNNLSERVLTSRRNGH